jgi:hypothetical protein
LKIVAGAETTRILVANDERLISLDRALVDGRRLEAGPFTVTIYETSGRSAEHCCYTAAHEGRVHLMAGDAVFAGGKVILQDIEDCSAPRTLRFHSTDYGHGDKIETLTSPLTKSGRADSLQSSSFGGDRRWRGGDRARFRMT